MKTSVIEVDDLLSVLTVDEVEKRVEDVAGVESATVNYAAKNATVRYDETLLEVADIKVLARQRGHRPEGEPQAKDLGKEKSEHKSEEKPEEKPEVKATPQAPPVSATSKAEPVTPATAPKPTAVDGPQKTKVDPVAPIPASESKPPANNPFAAPVAPSTDEHEDHQEPGALGKLTAWVRDNFISEDKDSTKPGAQAPTSGASGTKTSLDPPATEPKTARVDSRAEKHTGN